MMRTASTRSVCTTSSMTWVGGQSGINTAFDDGCPTDSRWALTDWLADDHLAFFVSDLGRSAGPVGDHVALRGRSARAAAQQLDIERNRVRQVQHVVSITQQVALEFGEREVVGIERKEAQPFSRVGQRDDAVLVLVRQRRDADDIEIHAVPSVKGRRLAGEPVHGDGRLEVIVEFVQKGAPRLGEFRRHRGADWR